MKKTKSLTFLLALTFLIYSRPSRSKPSCVENHI